MPLSDLELRERDLELRIAEKERAIGRDLEAIRAAARRASATVGRVGMGAVALVGLFATWRLFQAVRGRVAFPIARIESGPVR
jgi:hypothetical protein